MAAGRAARMGDCSPRARVTKSLLGYGVIAGPFYVLTSLAQALLTPGFSLARDSWSLLSLGPAGWVHVLVFVLTGLMVIAAAVGLRRHLRGRAGGTSPFWLAAYGALLVVAGFALPDRTGAEATGHGLIHLAAGGLGFIAFAVAGFLLARHFRSSGAMLLAGLSVVAAIALLAGFIALAATAGAPGAVVGFTVSVVIAWTWLTVTSVSAYREAAEIGRLEAHQPELVAES